MTKFKMFDGVVLKKDLPQYGLDKGTHGVLLEFLPRNGVAVEFFDSDGKTIEVALIPISSVRRTNEEEDDETRRLSERLNTQPS